MQFSTAIFAAAAFAVAQAAKIGNTASTFNGVTVGQNFNITWYDATGPVTLLLKAGPSNALTTYSTIATGLTGTTYIWSIPLTIPVAYYAFEIDDSAGVNYGQEFLISGGPSASSSVASSSASTSASSSSSSVASSSTTASSSSSASTTSSSSVGAGNSTTTASSKTSTSSSATKTSSSATTTNTTPVNSAAGLASPLAFVLLALGAFMTLN